MTAYHGGKQRTGLRIAKAIADETGEIVDDTDFVLKGSCEPFCGMLGVYRHIPALFEDEDLVRRGFRYKAGDANRSVVAMWKAVQRGWKPPVKTSEAEFERLRRDGKHRAKKGFIGHQYSFGGQYFQGFVGKYSKHGSPGKRAEKRPVKNAGAVKRVLEVGEDIAEAKVMFSGGPYTQFSKLRGYVIYCDPPYAKFSKYYGDDRKRIPFDHNAFWDWCRRMSEHNIVFVSEYSAPRDFKNVLRQRNSSATKGKRNSKRERVFIHQTWF